MEESKKCIICKSKQSIDKFTVIGYKEEGKGFERENVCDNCKRSKFNIKDNITSIYDRKGKRGNHTKYNITESDYNFLFQYQNGRCAICSKSQFDLNKKLVIDHDHETGEVRGLLCNHCNSMLGFAKDKIRNLERAIRYIRLNKNE